MKNLEIEYKVMISKEDFKKLDNLLANKNNRYFEQINYYYDTKENSLKKQSYSLRIRHIININKYLLTLKIPHLNGKMEYEYEIEENNLTNIPQKIIEKLNDINVLINEIVLIGSLKTYRKEFVIDNSILCLDYNIYNNEEDYEIECESISMEKAKSIVKNILNENDISYEESRFSKVARATKNTK